MSNPKSQPANVQQTFGSWKDDGTLSKQSMAALAIVEPTALQESMGIEVGKVNASEVTLVSLMIDDSGSIESEGNTDAVIDGHNVVLDALEKSKAQAGILLFTRYLNGSVLYPYSFIKDAIQMSRKNYDPIHGTPLYKESLTFLRTILTKVKEFEDNGVPVRTVSLIVTDGEDLHSGSVTAKDVATIVKDMRKTEMHIIAGMGVKNNNIDFDEVFQDMGLDKRWILTPSNSPKEIRAAFGLFSQSATSAVQGAASFSKTALGGGFATP